MATVLVAFATIDGKPSHIKVGKEIKVPPPATELIAPAINAAPAAVAICKGVSVPTSSTIIDQW